MQEEHNQKGQCGQNVYFPTALSVLWKPIKERLYEQITNCCAKNIGDQIIHIGGTEGQHLKKLDEKGKSESEENHGSWFSEPGPQDREKTSQRDKQCYIQNAVFQIFNNPIKRDEIQIYLRTEIQDIWNTNQGEYR